MSVPLRSVSSAVAARGVLGTLLTGSDRLVLYLKIMPEHDSHFVGYNSCNPNLTVDASTVILTRPIYSYTMRKLGPILQSPTKRRN